VASQLNLTYNGLLTSASSLRRRLFNCRLPACLATTDRELWDARSVYLTGYNISSNPNWCWWLGRYHPNPTTTVFLLRERYRTFWFFGRRAEEKQ